MTLIELAIGAVNTKIGQDKTDLFTATQTLIKTVTGLDITVTQPEIIIDGLGIRLSSDRLALEVLVPTMAKNSDGDPIPPWARFTTLLHLGNIIQEHDLSNADNIAAVQAQVETDLSQIVV